MLTTSRAVGLAALLALPVGAEDLTIVYKVMAGDKPGVSTTYIGAAGFKQADGDTESIYALGSGTMTMVDNKKKQYWQTSAAEMEAAMQKVNAQLAQMQEQMKNMPPALREKMMGAMGSAAGSIKVTKAGAPRSVAGYSCQPYLLTVGPDPDDTPVKSETCNTTQIAFPAQAWEARKAMLGSMASNPLGQSFQKLYDEMSKIEGFAVSETTTVRMLGKSQTTTREVTEVKKGPIPASAFEPPAGYKKVDSPFAKMK